MALKAAALPIFIALTSLALTCQPRKEDGTPDTGAPKWKLRYRETFENLQFSTPEWNREEHSRRSREKEGRYGNQGSYFTEKTSGFRAPEAWRSSESFGENGWLRLESYSRLKKSHDQLRSVVTAGAGKALKIRSLEHTDGTVLRSSNPLPPEYKLCLKVGDARFGTGSVKDGNGYDSGDERAMPWLDMPAVHENGFYWLAILFAEPKPRNNVWIHHHRKIVIDSDSNDYPAEGGGAWTRIWDGSEFVQSGVNPVMIFALDADNRESVWNHDRTGQPFISLAGSPAGQQWHAEAATKEIRAADSYLPGEWYRACIWKTSARYGVSVSGKFRHGGVTTYQGEIDRNRVFHGTEDLDFFMAGDPHVNFYEGEVSYDDVELYVPADPATREGEV